MQKKTKESSNYYSLFLIIPALIILYKYSRCAKRSRKPQSSDLQPYNELMKNFMLQFQSDIKQHGFVVVWTNDGVFYMEGEDQGFKSVSWTRLQIDGGLYIHREHDVVLIKEDKTYSLQSHREYDLGMPGRIIRAHNIYNQSMEEICTTLVASNKKLSELESDVKEQKEELNQAKNDISQLYKHLGLNRSSSFSQMLDQSGDKVAERKI